MKFCFYNDIIISSENFHFSSDNRAFKYGDGIFESIFVHHFSAPFFQYHFQRIMSGMKMMKFQIPQTWTIEFFINIINRLAKKNDVENARCKIIIWRAGEGLYLPQLNQPLLLIELFPLEQSSFILNSNGVHLGLFEEIAKPVHELFACKSLNAIPSILAALYAEENKYDDVLILNTDGQIADTINSNVFIVSQNNIITSPEMNGGVAGTMQTFVCEEAKLEDFTCIRKPLSLSDILEADECFLTNAIQGIKWVRKFHNKTFNHFISDKLLQICNNKLSGNYPV